MLESGSPTKSLERVQAGRVSCQFGRAWPPASLSFFVRAYDPWRDSAKDLAEPSCVGMSFLSRLLRVALHNVSPSERKGDRLRHQESRCERKGWIPRA